MTYLAHLLVMFNTQVENIGLEKQFVYLKNYIDIDGLTGIPTKDSFYRETLNMINENSNKKFIFILININKFQMINSFFGMDEGDRLLQLMANEITLMSKNTYATYGRMGADIFCMCKELVAPIDVIASEITNQISSGIVNYRFDYNLSASVGVFLIKNPTMSMEMIYSKAFIAAKKIKYLKSTSYSVYEDYMEIEEIHEQTIINDMFPALIEHQFEVYLQPKVGLQSGGVVGAEALIRWNHPTKGFIQPNDFIPIFERNGFITKLDYFVWESVFQFIQGWIEGGFTPIPIAVNLSRVDLFNVNITACFEEFLKKYNVPPELVHLEITESAYVTDYEEIGEVINQLKNLGFHIEMDDFGSGYSSLNMFSKMLVDTLKLDMIFLEDLQGNEEKHDILVFIINLAKHFDLQVVAEGIETVEQMEFLKSMGCDIGQGYYFSRPMPMSQFTEYLSSVKDKKGAELAQVNYSAINLNEILYPDHKSNHFFQKGLSASIMFKVSEGRIQSIRYNDEFHKIAGITDAGKKYKNNIQETIYKEDIALVFEKFAEAKKIKETISLDVRMLNFNMDQPKYLWFHIGIKLINSSNHESDIFIATVERGNEEV